MACQLPLEWWLFWSGSWGFFQQKLRHEFNSPKLVLVEEVDGRQEGDIVFSVKELVLGEGDASPLSSFHLDPMRDKGVFNLKEEHCKLDLVRSDMF